ncbi:hypothetical protein ES288_A05G058500v1 [Gossypium darwinii]|uniref:DYW domain-containing protein n=1 Tax=Gossypium darwinii TaxID=34276 RepID=A0A5D2GBU4_GOSDA|nr:hypothetical protein ES288_A05G058500v1 [Gossypium darwinii]
MQTSIPTPKLLFFLRTIATSATGSYSTQSAASERGFLTLLHSCNTFSNLLQLQTQILKLGFHNNPLILTKFIAKSSDLNSIHYAHCFLFSPHSNTDFYDAFLFNTIIKAYAQSGDLKLKALWVFKLMLECQVLPNNFTYPFVLKACAGIGDLNLGKSVHGSLLKFGFDGNNHVLNTLVHMYCSCKGGIEIGLPWSAMIGGYVRLGRSNDAVDLFRQMQIQGVCPDEITMVAVLCACTDLGALELGRWVESLIEKRKLNKSVELNNALIDMFAKCGDVDKALKLFRTMNERSIVSWTSVIVGLAMHGRGLQAVSLFQEMIRDGVEPDGVVFIGLLSACSHSGFVGEGKEFFDLMKKEFAILPKIEHYGCMVDMLCRAGHVREAVEFVQKMPIEPNSIIWRTLVNACRTHSELKLGESLAKQLIQNEPTLEANYVLLSNIYAKMSHWEEKTKAREVMDKKGMRKIPGSTMIELNNKIYRFVAGDMSHNQFKEIFEMVDEMGREMKRAGYVPSTSEVMLDIDEEDKEDNLNRHSEKLAIAFALMNTPPGTPIRIVKNLRVCNDCHSPTKFISKIYNREIIARDRSRFHHFKDGLCSCKDFW